MYYTKYRPQKFSEISQPNETAKALVTQIRTGKTVHAYLFVGPRGTGKTTTARILAKALNCKNLDEQGDPCNECESCLGIRNGSYLDLFEIDAASNRGIDDIRELKERIKLAPSLGKKKIYIIDEVHMLTTEAFNALLKTLEEPPAHVTFILCTTEFHKVPETIKSRCQIFKFKRATLDQLTKKLAQIAKKEKVALSDQELRQIASAAHGGFRDGETILQQVVEGELSVDSLTGIKLKSSYVDFLTFILERDVKQGLSYINKLYEDGADLFVWSGEFLKFMRDLVFVKTGAHENVVDVSDEVLEKMQSLCATVTAAEILKIIEAFIKAQNEIKNAFIVQLPLEMAVVSLLEIDEGQAKKQPVQQSPNLPSTQAKTAQISSAPAKKSQIEADQEKAAGKTVTETIIEETMQEVTVEFDAEGQEVSMDFVASSWKTVIKEVSSVNNSISALLKSAKIVNIKGRNILMEVPFDFHKERLENAKNRKLVESVLSSVLEKDLYISCNVKKANRKLSEKETGKLTDYNLIATGTPAREVPENILEVFDGGLPFN